MKLLPQIIGLLAVATFLFSFQLKRRKHIILFNFISRCLYILQYVLLGAASGAVFDILAGIASVLAGKKHSPFIHQYIQLIVITINVCIIIIGITIAVLNQSLLDVFALAGVLFEINALWLTNEKHIRLISLFALPCWFVYNILSSAYGSALGNVLATISIVIAMIRYKNPKADHI